MYSSTCIYVTGHPRYGGAFDIDELYFHGVMMYLLDADALGKNDSDVITDSV